jgi:hypothetical protein
MSVLLVLLAPAFAAPPPQGDLAFEWGMHRATLAVLEETETYRAQTVPLMIANDDPPAEIGAVVAERRAMLDALVADRARLAAETEAAGSDPTEQLAIHDAAVARMEALMPGDLAVLLGFKLKLLETMGGDVDEWRYLGDVTVATMDALPDGSGDLLLITTATNIGKAGDPTGTIDYAAACTRVCAQPDSRAGAWYLLMNEHAGRGDRAGCRRAALGLLGYPEADADWVEMARQVVEGTQDLAETIPVPEGVVVPAAPMDRPASTEPTAMDATDTDGDVDGDDPFDDTPRPRAERLDEPCYVLFRGGPSYDVATDSLWGEEMSRISGYSVGYTYAERHLGLDAQFAHSGWSGDLAGMAVPGLEVPWPPRSKLEMRVNRVEAGLVVDALGVSSERRLRPSLGAYGSVGLGFGKFSIVDSAGNSSDQGLLAFGVAYGAKAGLGVRFGRGFLVEAQLRAGRAPYAWGIDGDPLGYTFDDNWEVQAALSVGGQKD